MRLNKFISSSGRCSRREADKLISDGKVKINGRVAVLGENVNVESDTVTIGENIIKNLSSLEYWALYKPKGAISTTKDEKDRDKVTNYIKSSNRLYPVGRLDSDSEGLIILTNDGEFANKIVHPSHGHKKGYFVVAKRERKISIDKIKYSFEKGMNIKGTIMRAEELKNIKEAENGLLEMEIDLITGYNRQIRKMCDKIGLSVVKLVRTKFGNLKLSDLNLKPGESKQVDKTDIL